MDASFLRARAVLSRREAICLGAATGAALLGTGCAAVKPDADLSPAAEARPPTSPGAYGAAGVEGAAGAKGTMGAVDGAATTPEESRAAQGPAIELARSPKSYLNTKSINLWAFPYPQRMSLKECFGLARKAGFQAVELNYDLDGELSPKASEKEIRAIGDAARACSVEVSGLCSFLFWPYPLTSNDPATRAKALDLARKMVEATSWLGTSNLLVVPGAVSVPWIKGSDVVPFETVDRRAREAISELLPHAERHQVRLNIENIFFNGYLMSPSEMVAFVDSFKSPFVGVHFDTGNILPFQFPEHWIPMLGHRIHNVHLKEFSKEGTDFSLAGFRPLLDGSTDWPAVMEAFDKVGYKGHLTFEYFHPYTHYPEALIHHASDAMDRILGRG